MRAAAPQPPPAAAGLVDLTEVDPARCGLPPDRTAAAEARSRAHLAQLEVAALREAPWSVAGSQGPWAVLELGAAAGEEALRLALLEDGVVVDVGSRHGFAAEGAVAVSLLVPPERFAEGLARLETSLRRPLPR